LKNKKCVYYVKKGISVLIDETQRAHITWFAKEEFTWIFERLERLYLNQDEQINEILTKQSKIKSNFFNLKREVLDLKQKAMIVDSTAKDNIHQVKKKTQELNEKMYYK
jgi:hypothetical protein